MSGLRLSFVVRGSFVSIPSESTGWWFSGIMRSSRYPWFRPLICPRDGGYGRGALIAGGIQGHRGGDSIFILAGRFAFHSIFLCLHNFLKYWLVTIVEHKNWQSVVLLYILDSTFLFKSGAREFALESIESLRQSIIRESSAELRAIFKGHFVVGCASSEVRNGLLWNALWAIFGEAFN